MPASSGSSRRGSRGEGWVVAQALLLAAVFVAGLVGPPWWDPLAWPALPVGSLLLALGVLLALSGIRGLGRSLTPLPKPRAEGRLVETGIYGRVRHPIYGGLVVAALGWALLTASVVALVLTAVLLGFFVLKARFEEAWLSERFPDYEEYRRRTPRRFLPFP
jgi:protein-S-isoprenylcysteine O-methyltransferase Ste14